jgi:hypothetical protein
MFAKRRRMSTGGSSRKGIYSLRGGLGELTGELRSGSATACARAPR